MRRSRAVRFMCPIFFMLTWEEEAPSTVKSLATSAAGRPSILPKPAILPSAGDLSRVSGRMDNLRAAILRPQLADLDTQCARWTERYRVIEAGLRDAGGLQIVERPEKEAVVRSSLQFLLLDWSAKAIGAVMQRCAARGVELKWFGADEPVAFTSRYDSWARTHW